VVRVLGALLGWLAGSVLRIRRRHVEESMRTAGIARAAVEARAMYASLGASAVEFLWMAVRGRSALEGVRFDEASRVRWREALGQGRGVVVAASHTGNWDMAACAVARDVELLVVTKHLSVRWLNRFWQSTRARLGVTLSDALGPTAATDRAPAALAAAARVPLVIAAGRRDAAGHQVLHVLDVLHAPPRPSRAWVLEATRTATRALDGFVREHPSQWLWLHRRWKPMLRRTSPCRTIPSSSPAAASPAG